MSTPFLAELKVFSFGFPPKGWALCNGQLMAINQNQALFSLLGTTYGGDGRTTFGLPNLQGRVAMHVGNGHVLGEIGGEEAHTLNVSELGTHLHPLNANNTATGVTNVPSNSVGLSQTTASSTTFSVNLYVTDSNPSVTMASDAIGNAGGSQGHENRMPLLTLSVCIALQGIFPSQN